MGYHSYLNGAARALTEEIPHLTGEQVGSFRSIVCLSLRGRERHYRGHNILRLKAHHLRLMKRVSWDFWLHPRATLLILYYPAAIKHWERLWTMDLVHDHAH
jgi:hypothetical protein